MLGVGLVLRTALRDRGVLIDHLEFGRRLFAGDDLYATYLDEGRPLHPVYPPSFGLLTGPFALLGERLARAAWGTLQVFALDRIGRVAFDRIAVLHPDLRSRAQWVLLIAALLGSRYILRDTHGGGGNLINLALVLTAFRAAEDGRERAASVWLGLSLATKPTMVLLLPFFVLVRRPATAVLGVLVAAGLALLAFAVHGFQVAPFERWFLGVLALSRQVDVFEDPAYGLPPFAWMNQSLRCAVGRFAGTTPDEFAVEVPGFVQGAGLSPTTVISITRILSAVLLLWVFARVHRLRKTPRGRFVAFASVLGVSLLLSPISWKAHHTALLPAFVILAAAVLNRRRGALWLAIGYYIACTAGGGDLVGRAGKMWQQAHYLAAFGALTVLWWLGRVPDQEPEQEPGRLEPSVPGSSPSFR